jgi:hypothetical protein
MLLSKKLWIKAGAKNFNYFKNLGYDIESSKELFEVDIEHLTNGSHTVVDVSCDYCGDILNVPYKRYIKYTENLNKYSCSKIECSNQKIKDVCLVKYGVENPFQAEFVKEKSKKTFNEKYGVNHQMEIQEVKDKIKKTYLERYGVEHSSKSDEIKKRTIENTIMKYGVEYTLKLPGEQLRRKITRIKNGNQIPDNMLTEYELYRRQVDNISDRLKIELLKTWDGYDYYDDEYIKDYFTFKSNDKRYPTLDHKTSAIFGFLNKISVDDIAAIDNLCFTKNKLNAQKGGMNEKEYKKKRES